MTTLLAWAWLALPGCSPSETPTESPDSHTGDTATVETVTGPPLLDQVRAHLDAAGDADWSSPPAELDAWLADPGGAGWSGSDEGYWVLDLGSQGLFAVRPRCDSGWIIEAPHIVFERDIAVQATETAVALEACALLLNGAHRCSSDTESECDGSTSVCGTSGPYRISDVAHHEDNSFHTAHLAFTARFPEARAISMHGFARDTDEPHAYISDGTDDADADSLSISLRDALTQRGVQARSCNDPADDTRLCGTTNLQGRALNGRAQSCTRSASAASGRFLHIEQSEALRSDSGAVHRGLVIEALQSLPSAGAN